jgi:signal transduction histidine kinase
MTVVAGGGRVRTRVTWVDAALTAILLVVGAFGTGPASENQNLSPTPWTYVLVVAACLPVLVWRVRPLWTLAATGAAVLLYLGIGYAYGPIMLPLGLAIFGVAWRLPLRRALNAFGLLALATALVLGGGVLTGSREWTEFISAGAWLSIPAAIGIAVKARRDAAVDVRAAQARRAVSEERLSLAREVHDVAGHGFAVIAMQAGVALRVLDRDPAAVRAALEGIRATSKDALDDLRAELETLGQGHEAPLRPASGLADLPALVERMRSSGLPITLDAMAGGPLPAEVDRAAYRIVQESLTNVLRHAGPGATARVTIRRDDRRNDGTRLLVEIVDTGRGSAATIHSGRGLDGMRTRAAALGGDLDTGPASNGGFAVRASLPLSATPSTKETVR